MIVQQWFCCDQNTGRQLTTEGIEFRWHLVQRVEISGSKVAERLVLDQVHSSVIDDDDFGRAHNAAWFVKEHRSVVDGAFGQDDIWRT